MSVYLVRHAKAGSRSEWDGDDRLRPLSKPGRRQAAAIGARLFAEAPSVLLSSPYLRCVQTLEPLAERLGVEVGTDDALAEGAALARSIELLERVDDGAVLCSHGDVIPDVVAALQRRGCEITTEADWRKATVWVIERDGERFVSAAVWPPPE